MADEGCAMQPRQLLPPEAFISLEESAGEQGLPHHQRLVLLAGGVCHTTHRLNTVALPKTSQGSETLPTPRLCLCPQPGHPDPKRFNLNKIAFVLKKYLAKGGRWAVSWDCPSLLQPSLGMQAVGAYCIIRSRRPAPSLMCGSTSLKHLPHMWQHVHVCVEGGWCCCLLSQCFCESRWAMLTKEFDFALDLGKADGNGEGPRCHRTGLHQGRRTEAADDAERFRGQELKAKSFTNGKEDRPMVGELYRGAFEKEMGEVTTLHCAQLGWGDEEMVLVSKVIASGALPQLKTLLLAENQIGNEGMNSLCTALLPAGRWRSSGSSPW
eukprot:4480650-Prymnesium_polylepis.1